MKLNSACYCTICLTELATKEEDMPYRTPHGKRYHTSMGCHGATISCGTEGLAPCWYCDPGKRAERKVRRNGTASGGGTTGRTGAPGGSPSGATGGGEFSAATEGQARGFSAVSGSAMSDLFEQVASSTEVTFDALPEHYHEERYGVPGTVASHAMESAGISSLDSLDGYGNRNPGLGGEAVDALVASGDRLGAVALVAALEGQSGESGVTSEGGWAIVTAEEAMSVMERLEARGVEDVNAFKVPGNLRLVCSKAGDAVDISRSADEMTGADMVLAFSCTRRSANGPYQLVHYDQLACYVNGYMDGMNAMWSAYDGFLTELRGTVYDTRDMSVVSNPYYKFRNLNECEDYSEANLRAAIEANGGRMVATEKLDGSLIQLRYMESEDRDGGAWRNGMLVSTSNTLEGAASSPDNSHLVNVERLYIQNDGDGRYRDLARAYPGKTLCFEFVRPDVDPHVVTYDQSDWGLWLTGMRDVGTGRLSSHEEVAEAADRFGIPHPRVVATDLEECLRVVEEGDGNRMEGMVVDVNGWLVKMKLNDFLSLSHIHHSLEGARGFKDVLRMTHEGTIDDALGGLPTQSRQMVDSIIARAGAYHAGMTEAIDSIMAGAPDPAAGRREFADWVRSQPIPQRWKGYLFARVDGKDTPIYYADRRGRELSYLTRNELAEREAELEEWKRRQGR